MYKVSFKFRQYFAITTNLEIRVKLIDKINRDSEWFNNISKQLKDSNAP